MSSPLYNKQRLYKEFLESYQNYETNRLSQNDFPNKASLIHVLKTKKEGKSILNSRVGMIAAKQWQMSGKFLVQLIVV